MTKQTDTSAEAVDRLVKLLVNDAEQQNVQPCEMSGLLPDDEYTIAETLCALSTERNEWKARAERAEVALKKLSTDDLLVLEAEVNALADAYRAGLEAAANVAMDWNNMEGLGKIIAKAIRAQKVPPKFGGE